MSTIIALNRKIFGIRCFEWNTRTFVQRVRIRSFQSICCTSGWFIQGIAQFAPWSVYHPILGCTCTHFWNTLYEKSLLDDFYQHVTLLNTFWKDVKTKENEIFKELTYPDSNGVYARNLSQTIAISSVDNIDAVVTESGWLKHSRTSIGMKHLELLFSDFELNPKKMVTVVPVDVFNSLLSYLLDRCTTESLCNVFQERYLKLRNLFKATELLNNFDDQARLLDQFRNLAETKSKEIMNEWMEYKSWKSDRQSRFPHE